MKRGAVADIALSIDAGIAFKTAMTLVLREKKNPKGEGVLVYVPKEKRGSWGGGAVWLVIEGKGYALNARAKQLTPSLPWPREASAGEWERTGLDKYVATEALSIVYEGETVL